MSSKRREAMARLLEMLGTDDITEEDVEAVRREWHPMRELSMDKVIAEVIDEIRSEVTRRADAASAELMRAGGSDAGRGISRKGTPAAHGGAQLLAVPLESPLCRHLLKRQRARETGRSR